MQLDLFAFRKIIQSTTVLYLGLRRTLFSFRTSIYIGLLHRHSLPFVVLNLMYLHFMMTSSSWKFSRVSGPLCGEFTGHRWIPRTKAIDVFFDLRLNKRMSKQWWGWWFVTSRHSLWRHFNVLSGSLQRWECRLLKYFILENRNLFVVCSRHFCCRWRKALRRRQSSWYWCIYTSTNIPFSVAEWFWSGVPFTNMD